MDVVALKNELDRLCAECEKKGEPVYGDEQRWHSSGVSDEDIAAAEQRLGVALPQEVKDVSKVFSGVYIDGPEYPLQQELQELRKKAVEVLGEEDAEYVAEFEDGIHIGAIYSVTEWGVAGTVWDWEAKKSYCEALDDDNPSAPVCCGCADDIVRDRFFTHIGCSNYGEVFMDLNPESSNYGALYHTSAMPACVLVFKIAESYIDFIGRQKQALQTLMQAL